jgi:hypothetical protein
MSEFTAAFFDEASTEWKKNKKRVGQMYVYICEKGGCKRRAVGFCSAHVHQEQSQSQPDEKKVTHGYFLRNRSNAPVYSLHNP